MPTGETQPTNLMVDERHVWQIDRVVAAGSLVDFRVDHIYLESPSGFRVEYDGMSGLRGLHGLRLEQFRNAVVVGSAEWEGLRDRIVRNARGIAGSEQQAAEGFQHAVEEFEEFVAQVRL